MQEEKYTKKTAQVIDQIKRLFAMSEQSDSVHQAASALEKAQELMFKYNIEPKQLEGDKPQDEYIVITMEINSRRRWRSKLIHVISKHFLCKCLRDTGAPKVYIIGKRHNIDIIQEMFKSVEPQLELQADVAFHTKAWWEDKTSWKNAWYNGAVDTIDTRLREAEREIQRKAQQEQPSESTEQAKACTALILVTGKELEEATKKFFPKTRTDRPTKVRVASGYQQGRSDGHKIKLHKELS